MDTGIYDSLLSLYGTALVGVGAITILSVILTVVEIVLVILLAIKLYKNQDTVYAIVLAVVEVVGLFVPVVGLVVPILAIVFCKKSGESKYLTGFIAVLVLKIVLIVVGLLLLVMYGASAYISQLSRLMAQSRSQNTLNMMDL